MTMTWYDNMVYDVGTMMYDDNDGSADMMRFASCVPLPADRRKRRPGASQAMSCASFCNEQADEHGLKILCRTEHTEQHRKPSVCEKHVFQPVHV